MTSNDDCVQCGVYSNGATLCPACENEALKRNLKKALGRTRKQKPTLIMTKLITSLKDLICFKTNCSHPECKSARAVLAEVEKRFK